MKLRKSFSTSQVIDTVVSHEFERMYLLTSARFVGISARDQYGQTTYRYVYGGNFTNISPRPWIAATHSGK